MFEAVVRWARAPVRSARIGTAWVWLAVGVVALALGCGGRAERRENPAVGGTGGAAAGAGGLAAGGGGVLTGDAVLVIPVDPRDTASVALYLTDWTGEELGSGVDQKISLALGEEYPKLVRFDLAGSYLMTEDAVFVQKAERGLTLESVVPVGEGLDARVIDGKTFEIGTREVGNHTIQLEGQWTPVEADDPPATRFSVELSVGVHRVAAIEWPACHTEPTYVVSGAGFTSAGLHVLDEDGALLIPANASSSRSATVSVHAKPGTMLSAADGLASLIATGVDQTIEVRSALGSVGTFELIQPGRIDGLDAQFFLIALFSRGSTEINLGDQLATPLASNDSHIEVKPSLTIGSVPLCSPALPEWFELRSETPATCPIAAEPMCTECGGVLPTGASALAAGPCTLKLVGAKFNAPTGLEKTLTVEFVDPT